MAQVSKDYTISMNLILTTPTNCSTIFSIEDFLSIHITCNNTLQLKIQNNPLHNQLIHIHKPYTLNITLNPSNNHYSIYSHMQTYPFIIIPSPLLYTISHTLTIDNQYAQISNLLITINNIIFANIPMNFTTTTQEQYESIFGPDVTRTEDIVYIITISVGFICLVCIIGYIIVHKCSRKKYVKETSYEKVNIREMGTKYVDETPGDHDIDRIKAAQIPLTQKTSFKQKIQKYEQSDERKEGEHDHDIATDIGVNDMDTLITAT
eukprot:547293_1